MNNPVNGRTLREPESRTRWLRPEEAVALVEAAHAEPKAPHLVDFMVLALHTGMRRGELLGLEWSRVDLKTDTVVLEATHTKSAKRRHIPLNRMARSAVLHRANFRATHCPASLFVFCDQGWQRIKNVRRSFDSAVRQAGLMDFHIHDLRHTCAAWLVNAGVPMPEIRDLLGHFCVSMTEEYAHLAPENVRAAVAVLDSPSRSSLAHLEPLEIIDR